MTILQPGGHLTPFEIVGFLVFLSFFLYTLDALILFREIPREVAWLIGHALLLMTVVYLSCWLWPAEAQEIRRAIHNNNSLRFLATAGIAPALIFDILERILEIKVPAIGSSRYLHHFAFAFGFWWLCFTTFMTIKLWELASQRVYTPTFHLLLVYNFLLGAGLALAGLQVFGGGLLGLSLIAWTYIFLPRFGIPTVFSSRRDQREVRKAGRDIERVQKKLEKVFKRIDRL